MTDTADDNIARLADFQKLGKSEGGLTEDAAALVFAERYCDALRFDHDIGKWFLWTGTHWRREGTCLAFSWARVLARELARSEPSAVRLIASKASFAGNVERFARSDRALAVVHDIWDKDIYLLGTPGGTVDLRTGKIRKAKPDDYISKITAIAPADKVDCPRWLQFMIEATNKDQGLIDFLQQFAGYMLTGDIKEHALLFIYGDGGNGKGVFLNTLSGIIADYAMVAAMETFTSSNSEKHPTSIAMLRGARMVSASETEEGRSWAESRIKQMTGGDPITAHFMRQDDFTFMPQFKLLFAGNHQPSLHNVDDAARRRINIIPFVHKPPAPDFDLGVKLRAEWPGILRWMIEGCLTWQRSGLVRPQVVLNATDEYFEEQDLIRHWIEERCVTDKATLWDSSTNLFSSWSKWATTGGEKPGTSKRFSKALMKQGFKKHDTKKARGFRGIEAKPEDVRSPWTDNERPGE